MAGQLISGRAVADGINARTAVRIAALKAQFGVSPTLALITTEEGGLLKSSQVTLHQEAAESLGISVRTQMLDAQTTEQELIARIEALNADPEVHGILVLLPLPRTMRQHVVFAAIRPDKELEGVTSDEALDDLGDDLAEGLVDLSDETRKVSSTLSAIRALLEPIGFDPIRSRNVFVAGDQIRDNLVVARLLQMACRANVQVAVAWADDPAARAITRQAELVLVSVNAPELVDDSFLSPGAVVIDFAPVHVGERYSNKRERLVPVLRNGVALDAALSRAGHVAPALGGVGPVMMATVLRNLAVVCAQQAQGDQPAAFHAAVLA